MNILSTVHTAKKTAELIDEEVKRMVNEQYDRAKREFCRRIKKDTTN